MYHHRTAVATYASFVREQLENLQASGPTRTKDRQVSGTDGTGASIWNRLNIYNFLEQLEYAQISGTSGFLQESGTHGVCAFCKCLIQPEYLQVSGIARISVNICKRWNMYKY